MDDSISAADYQTYLMACILACVMTKLGVKDIDLSPDDLDKGVARIVERNGNFVISVEKGIL